MKPIYKEYLFQKNYLVAEGDGEGKDRFEVLFSLAALFGIRVVAGEKLAREDLIPFVSRQLGTDVPEPFYRGFPRSVRALSSDTLLFDQVLHYLETYGLGHWDEAGRSRFETLLERAAFREETPVRDFTILPEKEALALLGESVEDLLQSSRPLSESQYALVLSYVRDFRPELRRCASKNTAVRLLADSRDLRFTRFLSLSDVIRLADEINFRAYGSENLKKLNLRNQDRKFIARVMDRLLEEGRCDLRTCFEKKALWCGLLHHIHYRPKSEEAARFAACMRGKENLSVYSEFERALAARDVPGAVRTLQEGKGPGALLRNLNYLLSRCSSPEETALVTEAVGSENPVVLIQLLLEYAGYTPEKSPRDFRFASHDRLKVHRETEEETERRRSRITEEQAAALCRRVEEKLREALRGRLGRVYVDPEMKRIALPVQENTAQGGYGILPRGSRLPLPAGKKLRAFIYWERVDDIDLSVIGLDEAGRQTEFSWRTMYDEQSDALTYSGDQTSGFHGGSEYFDLEEEAFRRKYPQIRYLVFCANVFSGLDFDRCLCRAGYMLRDTEDSGEVFEPKTVRSSFLVNCGSTFAYLFGIDLLQREFVWLNTARAGNARIAGDSSLGFLLRYFRAASVINMYSFFEMTASELAETPSEADCVVSDRSEDAVGAAELIRSCDIDKVLALMNP